MIEPWKVKVSSGGSQVDAIISEEQWRSLGELERLQLSAAMTRTFRRRRSGLAPAIPQLSPEAAAQQRASVGIDVETVANAVAAATGISLDEARLVVMLPQSGMYVAPPGTATVNAIEFYSNGDVIHPNLAGASSLEPDGTVRPAPAGRR